MAQRCTDSITEQECMQSRLLQELHAMESNTPYAYSTGWFGFDAFYVIWKAFSQLDLDDDGYLTASDLHCYSNGALT